MDQIISFFQNPTIVAIFTFLSGAIIAYIPARYNATKPMKLEIKKRQFNEVYLPLYKIIHQVNIAKLTTEKKAQLLQKIHAITDNHIELVFPTLITLLNSYPLHLDIIFKNIDTEYLLLKKSLGYPSLNFFSLLRRFSFKELLDYVFVDKFSDFSFFGIIVATVSLIISMISFLTNILF